MRQRWWPIALVAAIAMTLAGCAEAETREMNLATAELLGVYARP
jgi:hypothetical protein